MIHLNCQTKIDNFEHLYWPDNNDCLPSLKKNIGLDYEYKRNITIFCYCLHVFFDAFFSQSDQKIRIIILVLFFLTFLLDRPMNIYWRKKLVKLRNGVFYFSLSLSVWLSVCLSVRGLQVTFFCAKNVLSFTILTSMFIFFPNREPSVL